MRRLAFDGRAGTRKLAATALIAVGLVLPACGGGDSSGVDGGSDGGGGGDGGAPTTDGTLEGTATKGPVANATVTAFAVPSGAKGAQLATVQTDAQGHFTMQVGSYSGPVLIETRSGTYTDEATNATMPMGDADVMTCAVPTFAAGSSTTVQVTPLTSMAQVMAEGMPGGMTEANVDAANASVGSYFSCDDILHTRPMDPLVSGSGADATQEMKNYGMTLAAMSQYAMTLGMTSSSSMVTAMMQDASDGVMDGMMGSTHVSMGGMGGRTEGARMMPSASGTTELASAMARFATSNLNHSGVPLVEVQPLINKLAASSGEIR
jgi:hypothetical protein